MSQSSERNFPCTWEEYYRFVYTESCFKISWAYSWIKRNNKCSYKHYVANCCRNNGHKLIWNNDWNYRIWIRYYLWDLKIIVYKTLVNNKENLGTRACQMIHGNLGVYEQMRQSCVHRAQACRKWWTTLWTYLVNKKNIYLKFFNKIIIWYYCIYVHYFDNEAFTI